MTEAQSVKNALIKHGEILGYKYRFQELSQTEFRDLCVVTMRYLYGISPTVVNEHYFKYNIIGEGEVKMFCYAKASKISVKTMTSFLKNEEVAYQKHSKNEYWYLSPGESSENADAFCEKQKINICNAGALMYLINLAVKSYNKTVAHYKPMWEREEQIIVRERSEDMVLTDMPTAEKRQWTEITLDDLLFWDTIDDD